MVAGNVDQVAAEWLELQGVGGGNKVTDDSIYGREEGDLTAASVPEYVGASRRTLSPGLTSISNSWGKKNMRENKTKVKERKRGWGHRWGGGVT